MLRKLVLGTLFAVAGIAGAGGMLFVANATPEVPSIPAAEAAAPTMPFVVKLHAQWCPVCMLTKDEWSEIEAAYSGRVNLVVFDSTSDATIARSRTEAARLGLDAILDDYHGASGMVLVIDPEPREIVAQLGGNLRFDDYRAAIDAAL